MRHPLFALALAAGAACAKSDDDSNAAFEQATGTEWILDTHDVYGTVSFALPRSGPVALPSGDARDAVVAFLDRHKSTFGFADPKTELKFATETNDAHGGRSLRFDQYGAKGSVPVDGGEIVANVDAEGRLESIQGTYVPGLATASGNATIASADAMAKAQDDAATRLGVSPADVTTETDTAIFHADGESAPFLAFDVYVTGPASTEHTFVDATTGAVVSTLNARSTDMLIDAGPGEGGANSNGGPYETTGHGYPAAHYPPYNKLADQRPFPASPASTAGQYALSGKSAEGIPLKIVSNYGRTPTALVGTPLDNFSLSTPHCGGNPKACTPKGVEIDAQATFAEVADQYKKSFGRSSFTGSGTELVIRLGANDMGKTNAFFSRGRARCTGSFGAGDGDPPNVLPLVASFDIIAHELTHGVSYCTWGGAVGPTHESNGIDEAMSDIMAMFIYGDHGAGMPTTSGHGAFLTGADYGRNLADPTDTKQQLGVGCASMDDLKSRKCYVNGRFEEHAASGIVSYAWYLMTFSGTHITTHEKVDCGMGWEKSKALWSAIELGELPRAPTFRSLANASIAAAQKRSMNLVPVVCAWKAVHVLTEAQAKSFNVDCKKGMTTDGGSDEGGSSDAGSAGDASVLLNGGAPLLCEGGPTSLVKK